MRAAGLTISICLLAIPGRALAQDAAHIQQMNRSAEPRGATEARQINPSAPPLSPAATGAAVDRSVGGSQSIAPASPTLDQLSREAPSAQPGTQLAAEEADAGPAPSSAQRAQGRVTAVVRPDGPDRCDPQSARRLSVACDRVIEARSSEFSSPDFQPLSAEQRLLATQRQQVEMAADAGSVARRLANGDYDESSEALAVASTTLRPPADEEEGGEPTADATAIDAIVAGITTLVTGAPPNP